MVPMVCSDAGAIRYYGAGSGVWLKAASMSDVLKCDLEPRPASDRRKQIGSAVRKSKRPEHFVRSEAGFEFFIEPNRVLGVGLPRVGVRARNADCGASRLHADA